MQGGEFVSVLFICHRPQVQSRQDRHELEMDIFGAATTKNSAPELGVSRFILVEPLM